MLPRCWDLKSTAGGAFLSESRAVNGERDHRVIECENDPVSSWRVPTLTSGWLVLRKTPKIHPVLGPIDEICQTDGTVLTVCGQVDWANPSRIPPLWRPSILPAGAGTAILNHLANRATEPLRYQGPYPTAALYQSLLRSFRANAPVETFVERVESNTVLGRTLEPPVEFTPHPFERQSFDEVCVETRASTVDAIYIGATRYAREATTGRRVVDQGDRSVAVFELGGRRLNEIIAIGADGAPLAGPRVLAPLASTAVGRSLPKSVITALWARIGARAPRLLRPALEAMASSQDVRWGDCGVFGAAHREHFFELHAGFVDSELQGRLLLEELAAALEPVALRCAQRDTEAKALGGDRQGAPR